MSDTVELTIRPNDKYDEVIRGELPGDEIPETEAEYLEQSNHAETAESYQRLMDNAPTAEDIAEDPDELDPLSWDMLSVSSDPDLVAKIATYFEGMDPDESTGRLRAKLRLLDCEVYAKAQTAARAELRESAVTRWGDGQ